MKNFILNFIPKQWILSLGLLLIVSVSMDAQIRDTQRFPMEQFMGVNIHREDPIERLKCVGFVREYHDWAVDEGNFYQATALSSRPYPQNRYSWNLQQSTSTKFDDFYRQTQLTLDPTGLTRPPICATMKQCLPYLAGGDTYGTYSEIKPVDYYQSGRAKPAIGFPDANTPLGYVPKIEWKNPRAYYWMADWLYQFSRRYGSDIRVSPLYATKLDSFWQGARETDRQGLNTVGYIELWNEPNKYWIRNYDNNLDSSWLKATQFTGAEYAAMASTAYDGHLNNVKVTSTNILSQYNYVPGVHSADPQMKFVMGGSAGIREYDWRFLTDMKRWFDTFRTLPSANQYPFDVINFHHYNSNRWFGLAGTVSLTDYAASPEEDRWNIGSSRVNFSAATTEQGANISQEGAITSLDIVNPLLSTHRTFKQRLVELRKRVKDLFGNRSIELWMSEFGFDTNEKSPYKAPTIYNNGVVVADQQEVQGQFLVRAYLEIASAKWDRAIQFHFRDEQSEDGIIFSASGLLKDRANNYAPKKSYYYVFTMKEALKGKKFTEEIKVGQDPTFSTDSVFGGHSYWYKDSTYHRVSRFAKPNGNATRPDEVVYVSWLPTKTNAEKLNVKIYLNPEDIATTQATIIQMSVGDINGVRQAIPTANIGTEGARRYVIVPRLSEMPIFIRLGESITDTIPPMPDIRSSANSKGISCDAIQVMVSNSLPAGGFYRVYYYERPNSEFLGIPPFNLNDPYIQFYKDSITTSQIVIANLKLAHNNYPIYIQAVDSNNNVSAVATTLLSTTSFFEGSIPKTVMSSSRPEVLNQLFDYGNIDFCYPLRRKGNTYNYLDEWHTDSLDVAILEFHEPYFIDAATLLDGTGAGDFQIAYWDGNTYKDWIKYTTDDYDAWKSFKGIPIPTTRLRITKSMNGRIRKVILKGRKSSNPTYEHSPVCGVDVPSIYNITPINDTIPTLSRAIQVNRLPNNSFTGVLRIDSSVFVMDRDYVLSGVVYLNSNRASIVVQSGKTLRLDTTNLRGCFGMWKGIVVEPGATLILNESQVRDAEIGLHLINPVKPHTLPGKVVLKLSRSVFEENQTGILSQSYYYSPQNVVDTARSYIVGCSFDGNFRDLHVANVNTTLPNRALVGIRLENGQMNIGSKDSLSNFFYDLANGIEGDTLTLTVANSFFKNIRPKMTLQTTTTPFSPISYGGYAVYAERSKVWLYGRRDTDMFQKVYRGLYGYRTDFNVSNVKLQAEQNVIQSDFSSGASTFTGNSLKSFNGSALHYWQAGGHFTSSDNQMDCGEVNAAIDAVTLGSFHHLSYVTDSIRMTRDTIRGANPPAGYSGSFGLIALNAIKKARIRHNQLIFNSYQNNTAPNVIGIRLELVENSMILRNYIKGIPNGDSVMSNSPSQVGILSNNSHNNAFYCNEIVNARVGMQFQLNNLATTIPQGNIAGNVLSGYNIGLKVDSLGIIGTQMHRSNKWSPISNRGNYSFDAALQGDTLDFQRIRDNLIIVKSSYLPRNIYPTRWFWEDNNASISGFNCDIDAPINGVGSSGSGGSNPYTNVADSSYQAYTRDPEAYIWMLEKQAYEVFADLPLVAQTAIMRTYLNSKQGTDLEIFYQLKKGFESLFTKDPVREAKLKELNTFMDNWATKKYESDNGLIAEDAEIFAKNKEYQDLLELEKQSTHVKAQALLQLNATLPDKIAGFFNKNTGAFQRPYVFYEKVLNQIYLSKIIEGTLVYTEKEKEVVKKIALMCPLVAGEAPMKARTLYKHFIDPVSLPESPCENVPKTEPKQKRIAQYKAYPNPTTGLLNLTVELGSGVFDWELCTVTGIVLKWGYTKNYVESLDMSDLANGLYLIRITEDSRKLTVLKVVILK